MSRPLFLYDLGSPYAWLAAERVDSLLEPAPEWVPVLLGGMFRALGRGSWARTDARAEGIAEVERRARERGLGPVRWPVRWPNDGLQAMRAAVYAHGLGEDEGRRFALAGFRLAFTEGVQLDEEGGVREAAARAGLDPEVVVAATADPAVKTALRANTDRALELGAIGVPTVVAGDRVVWGDDRVEEVAA